jgi:hypothetical protein
MGLAALARGVVVVAANRAPILFLTQRRTIADVFAGTKLVRSGPSRWTRLRRRCALSASGASASRGTLRKGVDRVAKPVVKLVAARVRFASGWSPGPTRGFGFGKRILPTPEVRRVWWVWWAGH